MCVRSKAVGLSQRCEGTIGGEVSQQASMEVFDDPSVDWVWEGAYHYDRNLALLMETMQQTQNESSPKVLMIRRLIERFQDTQDQFKGQRNSTLPRHE